MVLVIFLWAILASAFIFAKKTLSYAHPSFVLGVRFIIAGGILLGYQWFADRKQLVIKREDWKDFFWMTMFHVYLSFLFEFWSLQYVSALKTTIIYSSTPFIIAIFAYYILKERLSTLKKVGMAIGLLGLIPTIIAQTGGAEAAMEFFRISIPEVVLMLAVICGAYAWFIFIRLMKRGYSFNVINGVGFMAGGLAFLATSLIRGDFAHPVTNVAPFVMWLLLLILSANVIFYNLYGWLLKHYSITLISFTGFLCPCFATLYDWALLGGTITWHYFASLGLITLGLYIFYREEFKKKKEIQGAKQVEEQPATTGSPEHEIKKNASDKQKNEAL